MSLSVVVTKRIPVAFAIILLCLASCGRKVKSNQALVAVRDSVPSLHVWDVSTVVSDSGITRYRIESPEWVVWDKASEPNWLFPQGIHFEKFDENLDVFAKVDADSAIYYNKKDSWVLVGNVKAMNLDGETFETELLYIKQKENRIHTSKNIKVTQSDKIINGVGFESNTRLSKYTILNPTGIIPIDAEENRDSTAVSEKNMVEN